MWPFAVLILPLPFLMRFLNGGQSVSATQSTNALMVPFLKQLKQYAPTVSVLPTPSAKWLLIMAWLLMVGALTRPVFVSDEPFPFQQSGRNVLLAIDTSGSMAETDLSTANKIQTRFATVQTIVKDFIRERSGDNLGLILFGSEAYTFVPLSLDTNTTATLFDEAGIGIAGEMTAIGDAIALGVKNLSQTPTDQRVLILLSDGYNNAGKFSLDTALELAQKENVKIYTIGVGAEQQLIQTFFGLQALNPSADLDEKTLRLLADKTGGKYFRARSSSELSDIYETLNKLEPIEQSEQTIRPERELFYYPLFCALLFLLAIFYERIRK